MPISDFIQQVLQGVQAFGNAAPAFDTKNWSENLLRMQQMKQQQAEQAAAAQNQQGQQNLQEQHWRQQLAQQKAYQDAEIQNRQQELYLNALLHGAQPADAQQTPGGPGLYSGGNGPSIGAGGGQTAPTGSPAPPPQIPLATVRGLLNQDQQQSGGFGVNQPNQGPTGNAALAQQRFASPPTASAGGVVIPAAPQASPTQGIAPTVFNIAGHRLQFPTDNSTESMANVPTSLQSLTDKKQMPLSDLFKLSEIARNTGITKADQPIKQPSRWADAMYAAMKEKYPNAKTLDDIPIPDLAAVQNRADEIQAGEAGREAKQARLDAQKQRADDIQAAHDSDSAVMDLVRRDGQALFDIKDNKQKDRILSQAKTEGIKLPSRQIPKQGQMTDSDIAADTVQQSINRMSTIARLLGPASFGPMIGRLENAEGDWGKPVFGKDDSRAQLEQEFRTLAVGLTAQETKLVGGGRASVQLYNAMKDITPNMRMDAGTFLQGAMKGTLARAQMTKNAIKRWSMGEIEDPYKQYSPNKKGDTVTLKDGRRVKLLSDPDAQGNADYAPVQ